MRPSEILTQGTKSGKGTARRKKDLPRRLGPKDGLPSLCIGVKTRFVPDTMASVY